MTEWNVTNECSTPRFKKPDEWEIRNSIELLEECDIFHHETQLTFDKHIVVGGGGGL